MASANDSNTVLLLHCDGADEHTTFTDNSIGGNGGSQHTVTANGDAQGDTAQKRHGTASLFVDGDGDYLSVPDHADWNMDTDPFTIDFYLRWNVDAIAGLFQQYVDATHYVELHRTPNDQLRFILMNGSTVVDIVSNDAEILENTWHHISVIRGWGGNANDWAICLDGVQTGDVETASGAWPDFAADFHIGQSTISGTVYGFNGWIDEFRVCKGVARWTANFEAPSTPYPDAENVWMGKVNNVPNPSKVNQVANTTLFTGEVNQVATYQ